MRSQKLFSFYLTDGTGRSAYWENSIVKWSSSPRSLQHSPDGWKDIQPQFQRSTKYWGINRSMTAPLKLVQDGASIVRYLLYAKDSYETKLYLAINKWNDLTDTYDPYYAAEVDFTKAVDDSSTGITVNLIEGNILKLLNANDATTYEVPCDGEYLQLDGLQLDVSQPFGELASGTPVEPFLNHVIGLAQLNGDGNKVYFIFNQPNYEEQIGTDEAFYTHSENFVVKISELSHEAQTITLSGTYTLTLSESDINHGVYTIYAHQATDNDYGSRTTVENHEFTSVGETFVYSFTQTFTLQPGEKLFLTGRSFAGTPADNVNFKFKLGDGRLTFTATSSYASSVCRIVRPFALFQALLQKIGADSRYNYVSTLLDDYKHLVVSCITAVRRLDDPVIKTSFAEFFKAFNAILFSGFGVSGLNLIFEGRQYFYDPSTVTLSLGETSGLQVAVAEDLLANTAKIGYPAQDIESLNGRYSFDNTSTFELPVYKVQKEYEAVSPYLTDCYLIESKRINLDGKDTTDDRNDNNTVIFNVVEAAAPIANVGLNFSAPGTFLLTGQSVADFPVNNIFIIANSDLPDDDSKLIFEQPFTVKTVTDFVTYIEVVVYENPSPTAAVFHADIVFPLKLRRENYTTLAGVPTNTVYNIEDLTPKRMLAKHYPYLRSLTYWQTLEKIRFLSTDKNADLVTELNGTLIGEKYDVRVDKMGSPLFYPFVFSFKTRVPRTFVGLMYDAVNGYVQFSYNGFTFYGFPMQMSAKPDLNESQEWKLLAAPANNLQLLIDIVANPTMNINMSTYGMSFSRLCPVQFVPQGLELLPPYNFRHMDYWTDAEQKEHYPGFYAYPQPWQTSDEIRLQCITRDLGPVVVYLVNKYDRVFNTYPLQQIVTAAVKTPYQLFEGNIDLQYIEPGCYRLKAVAGVGSTSVTFLSEWLNICDEHKGTILFEYSHEKNQPAAIFSTGYRPSLRIKGGIVDFVPKLRSAAYEDQSADIVLLDSVRYRTFTLLVKQCADWMIDKVNAVMGLNLVDIDGKGFVRNEDAQFELLTNVAGINKRAWTLEIREAINRDNVSLTTDDITDQQAVLINVDTTLFGDLSAQVSSNPIQVEELNP